MRSHIHHIYIVAGGPSVGHEELDQLRDRQVIAINSSYERVPFADYLFFSDLRWWFTHRLLLRDFAGQLVTVAKLPHEPRVKCLRRIVPNVDPNYGPLGPGLSLDPDSVVCSRTSLQGAMNFAVHLGARRIVLIGADMCRAPDGRTHHHTPHEWPVQPGNAEWDGQLQQLVLIVEPLRKLGVEIINTSTVSRIPWWPKRPLSECL